MGIKPNSLCIAFKYFKSLASYCQVLGNIPSVAKLLPLIINLISFCAATLCNTPCIILSIGVPVSGTEAFKKDNCKSLNSASSSLYV